MKDHLTKHHQHEEFVYFFLHSKYIKLASFGSWAICLTPLTYCFQIDRLSLNEQSKRI